MISVNNYLFKYQISNIIFRILSFLLIILSAAFTQELTLETYLQKVIMASYERAELGLQIDEIDAQRKQLAAEYFPALSYSLNTTQSEQGPREVFIGSIPISQPATSYEYHSTSLSLSKQIFDWGNSIRKKKKFNFKKEAINADFLRQARSISEQAISLYFRLAEAGEIIDILTQELSDTQTQQMRLNELVDRGVKPPQDKLRMKITINEILSRISSQRLAITELRADVSFLMNEPADTNVTLTYPFHYREEFELSPISPALRYIAQQIKVSETELSILKWDRLPDLYLNAGYSRGNELFKSIYTGFDKDWNTYISLSLSYPLYGNNRQSLQETQKRIQIRRLTRKLKDEQNKIDKNNTLLLEQLRTGKQQIKLQEENITYFESIYTHERERYNSGLIEYPILKEAKNSLLQNKQSLIALKYKQMEYQEKLKLYLGEWDNIIYSAKKE